MQRQLFTQPARSGSGCAFSFSFTQLVPDAVFHYANRSQPVLLMGSPVHTDRTELTTYPWTLLIIASPLDEHAGWYAAVGHDSGARSA